MTDEAKAHCPRCRDSDLYRVNQEVIQCNDCGLAFNVEEVLIGVDPL